MQSPSPGSPQYRSGAATGFVDSLLERGRVAFPLSELCDRTKLSTIAARRQLARLEPLVRRVAPRQQFFLIVPPEYRALGAPPPSWWLDAYFRWLKRPYYLALQSAAAEYGSAAQAVQVTQVMSDRPRRTLELGRVRVQFFVKRSIGTTPQQAVAGAHAPLVASTPEATALDLIRYAHRVGGVSRAAETIAPMAGRLRRSELVRALQVDGDVPTAQRLGYVLDAIGERKLAHAVREYLPRSPSHVALDPGSPTASSSRTTVDERWALLVNAVIEAKK